MKKAWIVGLILAVLAGVYFGFMRKRGPGALVGNSPAGSGADPEKAKEEAQKRQEKIAQMIAEQQAIQQQVQKTNQSSIDDVQRTLRTVDEINRMNRQNQQMRK